MKGTVKRFNKDKGYGFIVSPEAEGKDIFFHFSELVMEGFKNIEEGAEVEFELVEAERGLQAHQIVKL